MALHRLDSIVLAVPDIGSATTFYEDFGLTHVGDHRFATQEGSIQLSLVSAPTRRLVTATFAVDDADDLSRTQHNLTSLGLVAERTGDRVSTVEPATGTAIELLISPRLEQLRFAAPAVNAPGRVDRVNERAEGAVLETRIKPRRLGHIVLGTPDFDASHQFFVDALGFKISDIVKGEGVFLRCSTDHHNILIQRAPIAFMHHSSWQVDDVDAIGRGAMDMLEGHPERHVWGLGRHYAGSNFFWYFKDPAGNFAEYHSDMDFIPEDALWTPEVLEGARGLYRWGPPPPPSFINPEDLADLMIDGHSK
ncbi:VOC family protein [Nocardia carnea]|uniref:VOC family protein n=1 Tax=Nocardia carnea TaxID=37328 RepID=UPI002457C364|nr:VOC family protein [Nocardia carnea]